MEKLEAKIDMLITKVTDLEKRIDTLSHTCGRMDGHINFVEKTYSTLRTPLDFLTKSVERLGVRTKETPAQKNIL